jgi:hypothetical protein
MTEKIQKDCEECGDLFEPAGYEGILNAFCGTCEKALPDGTEGCDEHGVNHVWSSHREEWIPDVSDSVASSADAATDTETDRPIGVVCDECGETTTDYERITEENWEFCAGLQKQFCGACREARQEPPCDDPECDADVCYDKREEEEND